jgi:DNA polymerase III delta prime subunit
MADLLQQPDTYQFYVMGYDKTLLTMPEKTKFLNAAADNDYYLFLEHDAHNRLLLYNILKKNTIEGGLQSGKS